MFYFVYVKVDIISSKKQSLVHQVKTKNEKSWHGNKFK